MHYSGNGIFGIPIDCLFLISFIYLVGSWQPDLLTTQVEFNRIPFTRYGYRFP